jgi:hypothetical protein
LALPCFPMGSQIHRPWLYAFYYVVYLTVSPVAQSGYGLDDWVIEARFPAEAKNFSSSLCVQTGSGALPVSCTMGTGGHFPGAKTRPGRDIDHSPHLVPWSRMSRSYISSPLKRLRGL